MTEEDIFQTYADQETLDIQTITRKADPTGEDQGPAADLQAILSADHLAEMTDYTADAQEDTEAPHHMISIPLQLQYPV